MVFRKLFREAGPPRLRPLEDGPLHAQKSSWSEPPPGMPFSRYPSQIPPRNIGMHHSAFQSAAYYPYPQSYAVPHNPAQYSQTLPQRALDSDQVYPGINYKPPSHQDRAKEMFSSALISSEPVVRQKPKRGHWRHKLFSRDMSVKMKMNKLDGHIVPPNQYHDDPQAKGGNISDASIQPLPGTSQKKRLQRALGAFKIKKGLTARRRGSLADLPITSSLRSDLPHRDRMERVTRKSLDSAYDTLRGRNAAHSSPYSGDGLGRREAVTNEVYLSVNKDPGRDDSSLPRLHDAQASRKQRDDHDDAQITGMQQSRQDISMGKEYPREYRPIIEEHLGEASRQHKPSERAFTDQDEWQQVHRKAVQKYADWIQDISPPQQIYPMGESEQVRPQPAPISSDKQAVYKLKGNQRLTTHVSQLFSPSKEVQGHHRTASGTLGLSLTRRGFAEKMFAEDTPVGILATAKENGNETGGLAKVKPLPDPPRQKITIEPSTDKKGKGKKQSSTYGHHADIRHYDWGSLRPPSHLALPTATSAGADSGRAAAVQDRSKMVKTPVPEQRANEASFLDSVTTPYGKGEVQLVRYSIELSPNDVINRIQEWRMKTSATPVKNLYAASASPTVPSDKRRSEDRTSIASNLTSVSRRATVDNNVITGKGIVSAQTSQVTVKELKPSPQYDTALVEEVKGVSSGKDEAIVSDSSSELARKTIKEHSHAMLPAMPETKVSRFSKDALFADLQTFREKTGSGEARDWPSLISNLAHCLESDTDNSVETLLSQHGKELRQLFKNHPEFLLMLSLKIKKTKARQGSAKTARPAEPNPVVNDAEANKKEHRGIDERGEISQIQTSLLDLHRRILDWRGDTECLTKRLSLLEQAIHTAK